MYVLVGLLLAMRKTSLEEQRESFFFDSTFGIFYYWNDELTTSQVNS